MPASDETPASTPPRRGLLPAPFAFFLITGVVLIPLLVLGRQPKVVIAAFYSIYVSAMALAAMVVFQKQGRKRAAVVAAVICALFVCLCVIYAYLAFVAH